MKGYIYILQCADNTYYTGSTNNLELRLAQHQNGEGANYTKKRLPIKLVFSQEYERVDEAFYVEKQVQGWSRKKKQALINGNFDKLPELAQCQNESHSSNATSPFDSAQGPVTDDLATTNTNTRNELQEIAVTERSRSVSGVQKNSLSGVSRRSSLSGVEGHGELGKNPNNKENP